SEREGGGAGGRETDEVKRGREVVWRAHMVSSMSWAEYFCSTRWKAWMDRCLCASATARSASTSTPAYRMPIFPLMIANTSWGWIQPHTRQDKQHRNTMRLSV